MYIHSILHYKVHIYCFFLLFLLFFCFKTTELMRRQILLSSDILDIIGALTEKNRFIFLNAYSYLIQKGIYLYTHIIWKKSYSFDIAK